LAAHVPDPSSDPQDCCQAKDAHKPNPNISKIHNPPPRHTHRTHFAARHINQNGELLLLWMLETNLPGSTSLFEIVCMTYTLGSLQDASDGNLKRKLLTLGLST